MNEREIVLSALEIAPPDDRARYVEEACGRDTDLRLRVQQLLRASESVGSFMDSPAAVLLGAVENRSRSDAGNLPTPADHLESHVLGDFRISREIGRGGMGVVYEAEQISLGRRVALKVLPLAAVLDEKHLQRFKNEAHAAAHLHHSNIVPVHSVGCERGVHYYAMQYIEGQTLAQLISSLKQFEGEEAKGAEPSGAAPSGKAAGDLDERDRDRAPAHDDHRDSAPDGNSPSADTLKNQQVGISTEQSTKSRTYSLSIANLAIQAAGALEHAHQQGIVHRDVKPSNLILDAHGRLWITDFGLARVESNASLTMTGDILGTVRYMSPEQALAKRVVLDHRTDIYSLGVTIYELLTLRPAYSGDDRQELLRQIAFEEPRRPRRLNKAIPTELETIVLKAMAKNPAERYDTAQALADDLQRLIENKPIVAQPPSLAKRLKKWSQRHQSVVASGIAMLLFAVIGMTLASFVLAGQRNQAVQQQTKLQRQLRVATSLRLAAQAQSIVQQRPVQSLLLATEAIETVRRHQDPIPAFAQQSLRDTLARVSGQPFLGHDAYLTMGLSVNGRWLVTKEGSEVRLWDLTTLRDPQVILRDDQDTAVRAVSSDRRWVFTYRRGDTATRTEGELRIWKLGAKDPLIVLRGGSPRGSDRWLAVTSSDNTIRLWDLLAEDVEECKIVLRSHGTWGLTISSDDRWLATGSANGFAEVWDLEAADPAAAPIVFRVGAHESTVRSLAFSPDSQRLAVGAGGYDRSVGRVSTVRVWDLSAEEPTADPLVLPGHRGEIERVAFSPNGHWLASGSDLGIAMLWDLRAKDPASGPVVLHGHQNTITCMTFSPDGGWLAIASRDQTVRLWDLTNSDPGATHLVLRGHEAIVGRMVFTPDNRRLITRDPTGHIRLWDISGIRPLSSYRGGRELGTTPFMCKEGGGMMAHLKFVQGGSSLITAGEGNTVRMRDLLADDSAHATQVFKSGPLSAVASSRNERWLATGSTDGPLRLWDLGRNDPTAEPVVLSEHSGPFKSLAFSDDGRRLAAGYDDGKVSLLDLNAEDTTASRVVFPGHDSHVDALSFSQDGSWLATEGRELSRSATGERVSGRALRLWHLSSASLAAQSPTMQLQVDQVKFSAFSPDSRYLATTSHGGKVELRDLTGDELSSTPHVLHGNNDPVWRFHFSPNGRWLAVGTRSEGNWHDPRFAVVRLWDLRSDGFEATPFVLQGQLLRDPSPFSADERLLATVDEDFAIRLWDLTVADPSVDSVGLRGHSVLPSLVAFGPRGRWLATSPGMGPERAETGVWLWDMASDDPAASAVILRVPAEPTYPREIAFSPDGQRLAAFSWGGYVHVWQLQVESLLRSARRVAGRELTPNEREQYLLKGDQTDHH